MSDWIDEIRLDRGEPYPTPPSRSSDCSVFHLGGADWGDAPDPDYPTLAASNGASHTVRADFCLGNLIDAEDDGLPTPRADGDDKDPPLPAPDDEDGVVWLTPLIPGQPAEVRVWLTTPDTINAFLDIWIDFDGDGDWDQLDQMASALPLFAGENPIDFEVPTDARPGRTYARFRLNSYGGLPPTGIAGDGEVEDYACVIEEPPPADWGDAPDPGYPTLAASNGASHTVRADFCLGNLIDAEDDGRPTRRADGDDKDPPLPAPDDEDGVVWFTPLIRGQGAQVAVFLTTPGGIGAFLDAWIDFDGDGNWAGAGDPIATARPLAAGRNVISFNVPGGTFQGRTYARFRLSSAGGLPWTGTAADGEVEDYAVIIQFQPDQGTLTFDENIDIPDHFWDPTADQYNEMLSLAVGAGQWDSVSWDTIALQAGGSGNDQTDVASVDVWIDNNNDGDVDPGDTWIGTGQYPGDDGALPIVIGRLQPPLGPVIISAGTWISVLISYTMSGASPAGGTYQFDAVDATGTGQTTGEPAVIIGLSIPSALKTVGPSPITIGEAKLATTGTLVSLEGKVLTADFVNSMGLIYVEEADRSAGIGVQPAGIIGAVTIGDRVSILGNTNLLYGTELMVQAQQTVFSSGGPIRPVGMNNTWTGGAAFGAQPGIWGAIGLSNLGMLVRTWGRITSFDPAPPLPPGIVVQPVFWIDDGANLWDDNWGRSGVAVLLPQGVPLPPTGQYLGVTGIMRCIPMAGIGPPVRLLCPRDANDIRPFP